MSLGDRDYFRNIIVSISNTRSPTAVCRTCFAWSRTCWMRISGTSAPFDVARRVRQPRRRSISAPIRWSSATVALGRDDLLPAARLALSGSRLRSPHRLSGGHQHPAAVQPGRDPQEAAQGPVRCLSRLRHRGLGEDRQAGDGQGDRRGPLARIRSSRPCSTIARRTCAIRRNCCAVSSPGHRDLCADQSAARHALERIQRQDRRADSGPRHADRHAAVEPGAGEQGGGDPRADRAVRSQPGQRIPDLHAGWRMEQLAVRAVAGRRPASPNGRDWIPARSSSTATPSG